MHACDDVTQSVCCTACGRVSLSPHVWALALSFFFFLLFSPLCLLFPFSIFLHVRLFWKITNLKNVHLSKKCSLFQICSWISNNVRVCKKVCVFKKCCHLKKISPNFNKCSSFQFYSRSLKKHVFKICAFPKVVHIFKFCY